MKNRNPLADWLTSTCTTHEDEIHPSDIHPSDALHLLLDGGRELIVNQSYNILRMTRRLSILSTRWFRYTIDRTHDLDWRHPLSAEFPILNAIESIPAESLAEAITSDTTILLSQVYMENGAITKHWSELSDGVAACLIADSTYAEYMTKL